MTLKYGSLFSGYGGLDLGLQSVLGGSTAWHVEFDKHPSAILAHHWPDVPNYGDITKVDFTKVEPVDVLTGGSPCQDLSHAGKRAGMTDGTRSNLWVQMREAIAILRPRLVVWENVRGALSAPADSGLESCPRCVGDPRDRGPVLRALGRVLGDLADLGYDARWYGLRAADVGAPHGRFRVFLFAVPAADAKGSGLDRRSWGHSEPQRRSERPSGPDANRRNGAGDESLTLLPTPTTQIADESACQANRNTPPLQVVARTLLPTPTASDSNGAGDHGTGGPDLRTALLLPTPSVHDRATSNREHTQFNSLTRTTTHPATRWGDYAPAIARWETVIGRPAPAPTEPGPKGNPRLSAYFVEWLMGLPAGHVTDVDIPRNAQLKALGNGVVPQQAAAATRWWLAQVERTAA